MVAQRTTAHWENIRLSRRLLVGFVVAGLWLHAVAAFAQPDCVPLDGPAQERAERLMSELYIHDGCDQVLAECLEADPVSDLALRLAGNVCRRVARGQGDEDIRQAMKLRARTMLPGYERTEFDLDGVPMAGDPNAPITVVEYADARGVHCARVTPAIVRAVTEGPLQGKVRLHVVVFPLRSNPHAKEAGLAFLAAGDLGGFWDYLLHAYAHFDGFTPEALPQWAEDVGLDRARFEELTADTASVGRLVEGKKGGLERGVTATPTFFIDGREYLGEVEADEIVDVLEEVFERRQSAGPGEG